MKYTELTAGESYAYLAHKYATGRRVEVISLDRVPVPSRLSYRTGTHTMPKLGVRVRFPERDDEEQIVEPRFLAMTWDEYQARENAAREALEARRARIRQAGNVAAQLRLKGIRAEHSGGFTVILPVEAAEMLLARLESQE